MLTAILCFIAGLFVGWVVLPAPAPVVEFWAKYGWAKKPS